MHADRIERPGLDLLAGAVDSHVHVCPHLNARSIDVLGAVREAAAVGMRGLGLMDNFVNSSGYAALAMRELGHLGVTVFGGLIMEPPAGGLSLAAVDAALGYGYGPGTGARFVSLPTHHTAHVARAEGRSPAYVESCLAIPERGALPEPLPAILDRIAAAGVVLETGHLAAEEALRVVEEAGRRGVARILVPANGFPEDAVRALVDAGAVIELSFFPLTHATQVGLTHVDREAHRIGAVRLEDTVRAIRTAGPDRTIVNSDSGVYVLPPPVEALREFLLLLETAGIERADLRTMTAQVSAELFGLA